LVTAVVVTTGPGCSRAAVLASLPVGRVPQVLPERGRGSDQQRPEGVDGVDPLWWTPWSSTPSTWPSGTADTTPGWSITPTRAANTSLAFGRLLREAGLVASMGSVGDCFDNAVTNSFFATPECELLHRHRFRTRTEARLALFDYLEGFYNPRRRHFALGQLNPATFERSH
jgi:transposase InsO family protein